MGLIGAVLVGAAVWTAQCSPSNELRRVSPPADLGRAAPPAPPVTPDRRLILTYYFYWYDAQTGAHLQPKFLNNHPLADPPADWRSVAWHQSQLRDMTAAGIDVALAVYWGFDRKGDEWSWQALPVLATAWSRLKDSGTSPPLIGLFLDTTIVAQRDLTTESGKEWFYTNVHDFFNRIPRNAWAVVNGRPLVSLFTSDFTGAMNQSTFDFAYDRFEREFGVRPYIVREVSWNYPIVRWVAGQRVLDKQHPIQTENSYRWGAAVHGFVDNGGVAEVGPGFDDRGLPGRTGTVTDRQNGKFYSRNFLSAIAAHKPLVAIETWNELHEASGVGETVEFGRLYINLTRQLAIRFAAG